MSTRESTTTEPFRGRGRGTQWVRVGHGLFHPAATDDPFRSQLSAWQLLLPRHGCLTHLTAARLRGWWLPPLPADLPVFLSVGHSDVRPDRLGVHTSRHPQPIAFEEIGGLRCACAAEVLLACARHLNLVDLVVLLDAALHLEQVTLEELEAALTPRRRGAPQLRRAMALADGRSESPWETLLRLLHVVCGIAVEPQHEIYDETGTFVARGDLWLVGTRRFHEYDGGDHLARKQQKADLRRLRRIDAQAWGRRGYTSEDVINRPIGILRDADRSVGRVHRPERIRNWNDLLRTSLFTPAGTQLLRGRLGLPRTDPGRTRGAR